MAKRGSYAKGISKREEILTTALEVFAGNGYDRTLFRDLAEAANLSQAGLLHYFGSKDELLVEVLRRRDELNRSEESPIPGEVDRFREVIAENVQVPGLVQLFATMSIAAVSPQHPGHGFFVERYATTRAGMASDLRERIDRGELDASVDPDAAATMMIALADGLQVQWLLDPEVDMPAMLERLWTLLRGTGAGSGNAGDASPADGATARPAEGGQAHAETTDRT